MAFSRPRFLSPLLAILVATIGVPTSLWAAESMGTKILSPSDTSGELVFAAPSRGIYSLSMVSAGEGVATVVDRMRGDLGEARSYADPSAQATTCAVLLEAGEYKVRVSKAPGAEARVSVKRFAELGTVDLDGAGASQAGLVRKFSLSDGQTAAFTLRVGEADRSISFSALGRSLGGAALLRDGEWEAGLRPRAGLLELQEGKVLPYMEFRATVDPGVYTVLLWGAPARPWAGVAPETDLFVASGERRLDDIGLFDFSMSQAGLELFRIPGSADFIQASASGNADLALSWSGSGDSPFRIRGSAVINPKDNYRTATLQLSGSRDDRWLLVRGEPGSSFSLRLFPRLRGGSLGTELSSVGDQGDRGPSLVRMLGSVEASDGGPLTALALKLISRNTNSSGRTLASKTLPLSASSPIRLDTNLLTTFALVLDVQDRGSYTVLERSSSGAKGDWQFVALSSLGGDEMAPLHAKSGDAVDLETGTYLAVVEPKSPGAIGVLIAKSGVETRFGGMGLWSRTVVSGANSLAWYGLDLSKERYTRYLAVIAQRGKSVQGLSSRAYPLDLAESPASLFVEAGESHELPITLDAPSALRVTGPLDSLKLQVDGQAWVAGRSYGRGRHRIGISSKTETWINLEALPLAEGGAPIEYLPFSEGRSVWSSFERKETKRFLLTVSEPSMYRVSSTGRLDMGLVIRGTLTGQIAEATNGGPGRNASVDAYLNPGRYLVEASSRGRSAGSAGVTIQRQTLRQLSPLTDGRTVRATVEAGESVALDCEIHRDAQWRVEALGLGRNFDYRFEDSGGWPVDDPRGSGSFTGRLVPGSYRFISLPADVNTRRVFSLSAQSRDEQVAEATQKSFAAELGGRYKRIWAGTGPDEAVLSLEARVPVTLKLDDSMNFRVISPSGETMLAGRGGEDASLMIEPGRTRVLMEPVQTDQDHPYTLTVASPDLVEGRAVAAKVGSLIPVSVGKAGRWELSSSGRTELEAALFALEGGSYRRIASSSPIRDDWNCVIRADLVPGRYALKIGAPGDSSLAEAPTGDFPETSSGSSMIRLRFRPEFDAGLLIANPSGIFSGTLKLEDQYGAFSFTPGRTGPYRLRASSTTQVELVLQRGSAELLSSSEGELVAVLGSGVTYTLRCGSLGDSGGSVSLDLSPIPYAEARLDRGGFLSSADLALHLTDPSLLSRTSSDPAVLVASGMDRGFIAYGADPRCIDGAWLLRPASSARVSFQAVLLGDGTGLERALALPLSEAGQRLSVRMSAGKVGLLSVETRGTPVSITESTSLSADAHPVDWEAMSLSSQRAVLGLSPGERQVTLRDSVQKAGAAPRRLSASLLSLPTSSAGTLSLGSPRDLSVPAGKAVSVDLLSAGDLSCSLESGLVAFVAGPDGRAALTWSAMGGSDTFRSPVSVSALYILNPGTQDGAASVSLSPGLASASPRVAPGQPYEWIGAPGAPSAKAASITNIRVLGAGAASRPSVLAVAGSASSLRFFDGRTGLVGTGQSLETPAGAFIVFPGGEGVLEARFDEAAADPASPSGAKAPWISATLVEGGSLADSRLGAAIAEAFVSRPAGTLGALPSGGAVSSPSAQAWTLRSDAGGGLLDISATGGGVLGIYGPDALLIRATASSGDLRVLAEANRGTYTVALRPFAGSPRTSVVTGGLRSAVVVTASGAGKARILGPGDRQAYRFALASPSRVGIGVRAEADQLEAMLYDATLRPLASGTYLLRDLEAGDYYLIVESGEGTIRYTPVFYGIEGSLSGVPDQVRSSYLNSGE